MSSPPSDLPPLRSPGPPSRPSTPSQGTSGGSSDEHYTLVVTPRRRTSNQRPANGSPSLSSRPRSISFNERYMVVLEPRRPGTASEGSLSRSNGATSTPPQQRTSVNNDNNNTTTTNGNERYILILTPRRRARLPPADNDLVSSSAATASTTPGTSRSSSMRTTSSNGVGSSGSSSSNTEMSSLLTENLPTDSNDMTPRPPRRLEQQHHHQYQNGDHRPTEEPRGIEQQNDRTPVPQAHNPSRERGNQQRPRLEEEDTTDRPLTPDLTPRGFPVRDGGVSYFTLRPPPSPRPRPRRPPPADLFQIPEDQISPLSLDTVHPSHDDFSSPLAPRPRAPVPPLPPSRNSLAPDPALSRPVLYHSDGRPPEMGYCLSDLTGGATTTATATARPRADSGVDGVNGNNVGSGGNNHNSHLATNGWHGNVGDNFVVIAYTGSGYVWNGLVGDGLALTWQDEFDDDDDDDDEDDEEVEEDYSNAAP